MAPREIFNHFDSVAYRQKAKSLSDDVLKANMQRKVRQTMGASWGIGTGIGAVPFTAGVSLIGTAYSWRSRYIAMKKFKALESEWKSRPHLGKFRMRKRDVIIPCVVGLLTMGIGVEVGNAVSNAGSHVFDQAASKGAHHAFSTFTNHAHHAAGAASNNTSPVDLSEKVSAAGHGFVHGVEQTAEVLTGNTDHITASAAGLANHGMSYVAGEAAGIHVGKSAFEAGAFVGINAAGERAGTKF
ncbi:hypothetical protein FRB95_008986 [Tulasnella sp. JGI-2019a]|nr:hypothetical protein FRB95_008986 [Tulasnella sp. JGI-2019a]